MKLYFVLLQILPSGTRVFWGKRDGVVFDQGQARTFGSRMEAEEVADLNRLNRFQVQRIQVAA